MRVFQVEGQWAMSHLRLSQRPQPQAERGQGRIKMAAAALNYRDLIVPTRGYGARMQELPLIMLSDGAGVVDQVGLGVTQFKEGDEVCPLLFQTWVSGAADAYKLSRGLGCETDGTMADYVVLPEQGVAHAPKDWSSLQAATLPTAALTAWSAVVIEGGVRPGDSVLVQGTGGVALFALQFAKMLGANVILTSSSNEKLARARLLGADHLINYREVPDWGKQARTLGGRDGVDLIVDVGGESSLPQSLRAVRSGGRIALIGVLGGAKMNAPLGLVVTRQVRMQGITVGSKDAFADMVRAIDANGMRPVLDQVFGFAELPDALAYLASGKHFGKVCIDFAR
jgi:NADPH:quinone reductase-like Zn-dependent oxidoreductase